MKSPLAYQRFHINLILEDWAAALFHIADIICRSDEVQNSGVDESVESTADSFIKQCFEHIEKHKLYSQALDIFSEKPLYKVRCFFTLYLKPTHYSNM